jgi:prophage regulatory protein
MKRLLRLRDVKEITGLGKSTIYNMMNKDKFPRPVRIAQKAVAWKVEDLDAWLGKLQYTDYEWIPNAKEQRMMDVLLGYDYFKDGKPVDDKPNFNDVKDSGDFDRRCGDWFKYININGITSKE